MILRQLKLSKNHTVSLVIPDSVDEPMGCGTTTTVRDFDEQNQLRSESISWIPAEDV